MCLCACACVRACACALVLAAAGGRPAGGERAAVRCGGGAGTGLGDGLVGLARLTRHARRFTREIHPRRGGGGGLEEFPVDMAGRLAPRCGETPLRGTLWRAGDTELEKLSLPLWGDAAAGTLCGKVEVG